MHRFIKKGILAAAMVFSMIGCGGGSNPPETGTGDHIRGKVILGEVSDATVRLYGLSGNLLGEATTDIDGSFEIDTNISGKRIFRLISKGGKYKSEADGTDKDAGELCTLFEFDPNIDKDIVLSALTTYACEYAYKSGKPVADIKNDLEKAYKELAEIFDLGTGVDFSTLIPKLTKDGLASGDTEAKMALVFGMFEKLAERLGLAPKALYESLASDFADDGAFGKYYADFLAALESYLSANDTELAEKGLKGDAKNSDAVKGIRSGIVAKAPASSGINVASSGAVTTLSYKGKQYVYIAARDKGLVGYDITDPTSPIEQNLTLLNDEIEGRGMSSIGGVVPIPGKADPMLMVYAYDKKEVLFVNIDTKIISGSTEVNVTSTQSFSGGSAYISSGIPDPIRGGVWLATKDGYWFVDTTTYVAESAPISLANNQIISENIGADISQNILFSPDYGAGSEGGLQLVNLTDAKSYSLDQTEWSSTIGSLPGMFSADSGAVDTAYHIGIVGPEDSYKLGFIDLSDMTKFSFDDANRTFSFGENNNTITSFDIAGPGGGYPQISNIAVDSETHLMLLSAGYSTLIGVAKLEAPTARVAWNPISKRAYYNAVYGEYSYAEDPHAAGIVNSVYNGKSYGYILSSDGYVLQIDMQAFLDAGINDDTGSSYDSYLLSTSPFDANGSIIKLAISN